MKKYFLELRRSIIIKIICSTLSTISLAFIPYITQLFIDSSNEVIGDLIWC